MANIDQTEATAQLNASLGKATYTATTTPVKLRLMTTTPTATTTGTEVTGGSYATGGQDLSAALGTASAGSITTTSAVNFTGMPATTVTAVEIWDSAGTPKRKWFGTITSKTTNAGDTLTFAAGSIVISTG